MLHLHSMNWRVLGFIFIFLLSVFFVLVVSVQEYRGTYLKERKSRLKSSTDLVYQMINHYYNLYKDAKISEEDAKESVKSMVRKLRLQGNEYFWILDISEDVPKAFLHPLNPEFEGIPVTQVQENNIVESVEFGFSGVEVRKNNENIGIVMEEIAKTSGEGFIRYRWQKPLQSGEISKDLYPKIAFVKEFEPWHWVIGLGIYIDDLERSIVSNILEKIGIILLVVIITFLLLSEILGNLFFSFHDFLTGLPNRLFMMKKLEEAMKKAEKRRNKLVIGYVDLDGFKWLNDLYGHSFGDKVLKKLSKNLQEAITEDGTIFRVGGDEFVFILENVGNLESSVQVAEKVLKAINKEIEVEGRVCRLAGSVGMTYYPQEEFLKLEDVEKLGLTYQPTEEPLDPEQLIRQADMAMFEAKKQGYNNYYIFDSKQLKLEKTKKEMVWKLKRSLENKEILPFYQPIVNMVTGQVVGVEALARWITLEEGVVPASVFLPYIERHPLMIELDEHILDLALSDMEKWRERNIYVSVNISPEYLQHLNFTSRLKKILERHPLIRRDHIIIEITESSLIEDLSRIASVMEYCKKELGVKFAIDDFGTGYSSLVYLEKLPVSIVKLSGVFIRGLKENYRDEVIVSSVVALSKAFNNTVIAEGVETPMLGKILVSVGCELGQGYGIALPMSAQNFESWIEKWQLPDEWKR